MTQRTDSQVMYAASKELSFYLEFYNEQIRKDYDNSCLDNPVFMESQSCEELRALSFKYKDK